MCKKAPFVIPISQYSFASFVVYYTAVCSCYYIQNAKLRAFIEYRVNNLLRIFLFY